MTTSLESHAHENGVVPAVDPAVKDRSARLVRAAYAGASAGLRTFTIAATALRTKDNAWAPLVGTLARTELVYDKLPATPTRLSTRGLLFRVVSAAANGAALATRKDPAWLPLAGVAVAAALVTAYVGATIRIGGAEREIPDFLLAAIEDQLAITWADRAFPVVEPVREFLPAVKTVSLL